ncbi:hypothetical protein P3T21_006922, partial [Paraburkholderia sp. GAS334]
MDLSQVSSSPSHKNAPVDQASHVALFDERPFLKRLGITDWLFALAMVAGAGFALSRYSPFMN